MHILRFAGCALAMLGASCVSRVPVRSAEVAQASRTRELPAREKLPAAAREMLTSRMDRHGDRMDLLMENVVLLNYEVTQVLANELASEPKLGRPTKGEKDTLNALLPAAFFTHQDDLVVRARALASAAQAHDDAKLIAAFTDLAGTCVACHSAYLYEEDELPVDDEAWRHEADSKDSPGTE